MIVSICVLSSLIIKTKILYYYNTYQWSVHSPDDRDTEGIRSPVNLNGRQVTLADRHWTVWQVHWIYDRGSHTNRQAYNCRGLETYIHVIHTYMHACIPT